MLAGKDLLERTDRLFQGDEFALETSEDLGDLERLRHETLDLTSTLDGKLVGLGKFVHTQNGNDILERLVVLEDLLDRGGDLVVLLADLPK